MNLQIKKRTMTPDNETHPSPESYFTRKKALKGGALQPHQNP